MRRQEMKKETNDNDYSLTWITSNIATGRAPQSYEELDMLKERGIDAVLNLCGEFSDLHELEEGAGFEVFWLPTPDETAPSMEEMEKGLAWLDEAVYLGKKVLVHCHYGIGRTGTFITAYLLRRGFNLKKAGKTLKKTSTPASPSNFSQWWLLRKFGKKEGQLTVQEPDPQNRRHESLEPFFLKYELLFDAIERNRDVDLDDSCRDDNGRCSHNVVEIELIEALYLHTKANITLSAKKRSELIENPDKTASCCALFRMSERPLFKYRPVTCRLCEVRLPAEISGKIRHELSLLSKDIFKEVFSIRTDTAPPLVKIEDVITGKFIQKYFQYLAGLK